MHSSHIFRGQKYDLFWESMEGGLDLGVFYIRGVVNYIILSYVFNVYYNLEL